MGHSVEQLACVGDFATFAIELKEAIVKERVVGLEGMEFHVRVESLSLLEIVGSNALEEETTVTVGSCGPTDKE